ncbi:phage/plasmid primase, P4 family [Klebsiella pneumoniae]|uniref:phage/plasmid primase, P4 family n=1 Tax=Klebsiella pneumoniae TaxID=573 RepID=UPI000B9ADFC7
MTDILVNADGRVKPHAGLSKFDQFIICKFAPGDKPGKTEKLPCDKYGYSVNDQNGNAISAHDPVHWMSYDEAQRLSKAFGKGYGVGFVITENDPFYCLDIDGALQPDNTWSPLATELCQTFPDALIELSHSRKGLHIWFKAQKFEHGCKNIPLNIELYSHKRFIALGQVLQGSADVNMTAELNNIISRHFPVKEAVNDTVWRDTHAESSNPIADDDRLIEAALRSSGSVASIFGGKLSFRELWEGDVPEDSDRSSLDQSLANRLAWWTGGNHARIQRLMKRSGLVRDKWTSHRSYLRRTITNAVAQCESYYTGKPDANLPMALPVPDVQPFDSLQVAKGVCIENDHVLDADILRTTVFDNRLVDFGGAAYWWNGQKWELAEESLMRRYVGESMVRAIGQEHHKIAKATQSRINGTLAVMRDRLDRMGAINPVSRLVFFRNGALDVDTGELMPHNPENRNSNVLSCDYSPAATCKAWQSWLADIFASDLERVQLLQEIIGWSLITDNLGIQKAPIFIGAQRAGKGTILNVVSTLLNDAAGAFQLPNLDNDKVLAGMTQRNVVIDYDTASPDKKNSRQIVGLFKAITANEPVSVKLLYTQVPFQGALNCKLLLASNTVPTMWDDSTATANRWLPLVFDRSFLGAEDTTLSKRLVEELPGIALWALEGLRRLMSNGRFTMPESSRYEMDYMVESGSPVTRFMDEECVFEQTERVADNTLWSRYQQWCIANGMEQMKRKNFLQAFKGSDAQWNENSR